MESLQSITKPGESGSVFFCETCGGNDGIIQPELRTCQVSESSGYVKIAIEAMAIEIVDLPINSMVIFYN